MLEDFISHIRLKNLLDQQKRYLLAISGGVDSVALGYLLLEAGYKFDLATVNYNLRAESSQKDFDFVKNLSKTWGVVFYGKEIDPRTWDANTKDSIQMKAREIRYDWLESLVEKYEYEGILVAHHFEDQLETIWLHLLRGCGIDGVYGMADRRGRIIRPLLPFKKQQLINFVIQKNGDWREDESNQKDVYQRNFIRNQLLEKVEERFPSGLELMAGSFGRIKDTGKAFHYLFDQWKNQTIEVSDEFELLKTISIRALPGRHSFLFFWLRDFGFSSTHVEDILNSLDSGQVGKLFHSPTHTLNLDRNYLILGKKLTEVLPLSLHQTDVSFDTGYHRYDVLRTTKDCFVDKSSINAMMDASQVKFPLEIRTWKLGDRFIPLGMSKEKKISDFLVDLKVPMLQKQHVQVMLSEGIIIWVIGLRISDLVKIRENTQEVLYFKFHEKL